MDGAERSAEHPDTFEIPPAAQRRALTLGEIVKLGFELTEPVEGMGGERMWVRITDADHPQYAGVLESAPQCIPGLELGSLIRFESRHIIAIYEPSS
jgi:hypothetical protein